MKVWLTTELDLAREENTLRGEMYALTEMKGMCEDKRIQNTDRFADLLSKIQ